MKTNVVFVFSVRKFNLNKVPLGQTQLRPPFMLRKRSSSREEIRQGKNLGDCHEQRETFEISGLTEFLYETVRGVFFHSLQKSCHVFLVLLAFPMNATMREKPFLISVIIKSISEAVLVRPVHFLPLAFASDVRESRTPAMESGERTPRDKIQRSLVEALVEARRKTSARDSDASQYASCLKQEAESRWKT